MGCALITIWLQVALAAQPMSHEWSISQTLPYMPDTLFIVSAVYKNIQINLVIASLATFGISPLTLSPDDLDVMLQTTYHLFNDQPDLCSMFWDVNALAKEPMFHFLNVARDIFPAVPMPLLYMLAGVCNGPQNATQVHLHSCFIVQDHCWCWCLYMDFTTSVIFTGTHLPC